jgi:hypothetical protein
LTFPEGASELDSQPIHITPGHTIHRKRGVLYIRKCELVAEVAIKLQTARIKIAPTLAEAEILKEELKNFKCKISSLGYHSYGAGDTGESETRRPGPCHSAFIE